MTNETADIDRLREAAKTGEGRVLGELLGRYRDRLRQMVRLRLDRRLRGRVDPSDVIQEAYIEASQRLTEFLEDPPLPFFLWLRFLTGQQLATMHRRHLGIQARDAGREVSLYHGALPEATSAALAAQLVGRLTSPSVAAMRAEMQVRLQEVLNSMDPTDREVLTLRHFEQLSNVEAAQVLGISEGAASNRYLRALKRLKQILASMPGFLD